MNAFCPACARPQGERFHCCPSSAVAELEDMRCEIALLTEQVRLLQDENEVLEALRSDLSRQVEELEAQACERDGAEW